MRKIIIAAVLAALSSVTARAADLPVKAPVSPLVQGYCYPGSCSGFYAGVNIAGVMTNANVIGNGVNGSLAGGGQSIGVQAGYQFANGTWFFGPEIQANYVTTGNDPVAGNAKYRVGEYLKVGTSLANLLNLGGGVVGPVVPSALAARVISPYVILGAVQSGFGQGWATGAGVEFALAQHWFLDTRYTYVNYGSATVQPGVVAKSENLVTVGFNYKF